MKNVRIKYIKYGTAKYVSHLDMNRLFTRVLQRAKLPLWRTEGFNPHLFITFALPLSLGFTGMAEYMDMRLLEDMDFDEIKSKLNSFMPLGIEVTEVYEPIMKPNDIESALFEIKLTSEKLDNETLKDKLVQLLESSDIIVPKKTKSGIKDIDLKPYITDYTVDLDDNAVSFNIKLPAGNTVNINPSLIITALEKVTRVEIYADITRSQLFDKDGNIFR